MPWRGFMGRTLTEADFARDLVRDRPDAAAWVYDPKARTLSQPGNVLSLVNIYGEYSSAPKSARQALLTKYRALLAPVKISSLWSFAQTRIYPLLRSKFDRVALEIDRRREAGELLPRAARPFLGDLELVVGYDMGASVSQVPIDTVDEWGVSIDQALDRALANLKALPTPRWKSVADFVWQLESEGSYNESFVQWPKVFDSLPMKGEMLAAVPNRGVLLAGTREGFDALANVIQKSLQEKPWPLSGTILNLVDGRVGVFSAPEVETRLKSLANLSLHSVYKNQQAALRTHCEAIEEDVFIASFGLISFKENPQQFQSWCSWTEGVESLLPKTDLIAFVRSPSHSRKTILVNWTDATAVVGQRMLSTSESPPRIQVDEFPSEEEWAELEKMAIVAA